MKTKSEKARYSNQTMKFKQYVSTDKTYNIGVKGSVLD
jgi:hypothetical protein